MTLGRYEVLGEIGHGGMASVHLARHRDIGRLVALKRLDGLRAAADASFSRRFLRESQLAGALSHPNVVTVYDYFEDEGTPYIAMEYLERGSLRPFVGGLTLPQIAGVLEGLLAALSHAEEHGVVHRDIKPENVMVTNDGHVKIGDFGIAKVVSALRTETALTATGVTIGTPAYMAPEQAMAQELGPWTDLYAVGVLAFELLIGHVPFEDEAPTVVLMRHVNEPIPPVHTLDSTIDADLSAWVERLLVKDPDERVQSATDAWDTLEEVLLDMLGPRWRRAAPLLEPWMAAPPVSSPKPAASGRKSASRDAAALAATRPPQRPPSAAIAAARPPRRADRRPGRRARWPRLAMLAGVLIAVAAALASASGLVLGPSVKPDSGAGGGAIERPAIAESGNAARSGAASPGAARSGGVDPLGSTPPSTIATAPGFALDLPSDWAPLSTVPDTGLPLKQPAAWSPGDGSAGEAVVAGRLPASVVAALRTPAGASRKVVQLPAAAQFPTWRYGGLATPDGREMTLYVIAHARDAATVACTVSPSACDAIADTLRVTDPTAAPPSTGTAPSVGEAPSTGTAQPGDDESNVGDSRSDDPSDDSADP
jgi:hypothetical protein